MTERSTVGVIFDMDGVLVDSAEPHFRSWQLLAEELNPSITRNQFATTFGRQNRDIVPILFGPMTESRLQALSERKEELYREIIRRKLPLMPGAQELVVALHEAGVRLAVGSSGPRANIELVLNAMGMIHRFDALICAEDVTRGKPDPQVFLTAAQRLGLSLSRCIVIEDAPVGIQAASAAGAFAVAVLSTHQAEAFQSADPNSIPHLVVERLQDLRAEELLKRLPT